MNTHKFWLAIYLSGASIAALSLPYTEEWSILDKILTSILWPIAFFIASWQHILS